MNADKLSLQQQHERERDRRRRGGGRGCGEPFIKFLGTYVPLTNDVSNQEMCLLNFYKHRNGRNITSTMTL